MTRFSSESVARLAQRFISRQPENWRDGMGRITVTELGSRVDFAKRCMSSKTKAYIERKGWTLEIFVESHGDEDRVGFCELLAGDWIEE